MPNKQPDMYYCMECNTTQSAEHAESVMKTGYKIVSGKDYRVGKCKSCDKKTGPAVDDSAER